MTRIVRITAEPSHAPTNWIGVIKARNGRIIETTGACPSWQSAIRAAENIVGRHGWDVASPLSKG